MMIGRSIMAALLTATAMAGANAAHAAEPSVFPTAPQEPSAITVAGKGDGQADDSDAIQQALDSARDKTGHGMVFLPSGTYRITRTLIVPPGVRIYGVGPTRPVILLGARTPGFQQGVSTMIVFGGGDQYRVGDVPVPVPTIVPRDKVVRDANSGTFYSAMSNVDIEIGAGNPAAAGVRFHMAQHAFLSHMEFRLGDGFAGVYQAGNIIENVHFQGGRYGIVTEKTSPAWQFTLIDSTFDGQRDAAIREHEVDLTLVNVAIRNTPVGIEVDRGYGDSLWGKDVRFENVSRAGVVISNENNVFTQIGFENALAKNSPVFARFRESGRTVDGKGDAYKVASFSYGLMVPDLGQVGEYRTDAEIEALPALPARRAPAIRDLPPMQDWVNVRTLGIVGDGKADDTAAIQKAINAHPILYFPTGFYKVTDKLTLRPDSILIGLHPAITQLYIPDENPRHAGLGSVLPILESRKGGDNILSGLGLFTGRVNPRASALLWRSGEKSLVEDVKIMGGGGTPTADGKMLGTLTVHTGDPVTDHRLDAQYPSIWVTDGGGGTFADVWSPNSFAQAGFYISDTSTPGHVYEMSVEHHARNEFVLDNVQNWEFLAPQTEQEVGDGPDDALDSGGISKEVFLEDGPVLQFARTCTPREQEYMQEVVAHLAGGATLHDLLDHPLVLPHLERVRAEREAAQSHVAQRTEIIDRLAVCRLDETPLRINGYLVTAWAGDEVDACCIVHGYSDGSIETPERPALGASFYANSFLPQGQGRYDLSRLATALDPTGGGHANVKNRLIRRSFNSSERRRNLPAKTV